MAKIGRPRKAKYEEVLKLRSQGLSLRQIGKEIGCVRSTVSKVLKKAGSCVVM